MSRNEQAIEEHKHLLAWQVYATNAPVSVLCFEACVWKYRYQSILIAIGIERRFAPMLRYKKQSSKAIASLFEIRPSHRGLGQSIIIRIKDMFYNRIQCCQKTTG